MREKKFKVTKANSFIQAKDTSLNLVEAKIMLCVIAKIQMHETKLLEIVYPVQKLASLLDIDINTSYTRIHQAVRSLMKKVITYTDEDGNTVTTAFLSSVKTAHRSGMVYFEVSEVLKKELIQLKKNFTTYYLINALRLNSRHSLIIYELLKQYERIKKRRIGIIELKEYLGIKGKYSLFANFEMRVLKVAIDEINKHTDIYVTYSKIKDGRDIVEIEFIIESQVLEFDREQIEEEKISNLEKKESNYIDLDVYKKIHPESIKKVFEYTDNVELRRALLNWIKHSFYIEDPVTPPRLDLALDVLNTYKISNDPEIYIDLMISAVRKSLNLGKTWLYSRGEVEEFEQRQEEKNYGRHYDKILKE